MDKEDCIQEVEKMLADEEFYKIEETDKTAKYAGEIRRYVEDLGEHVTKKEKSFFRMILTKIKMWADDNGLKIMFNC